MAAVVYLNDATAAAINAYLVVRREIDAVDKSALFLSNRRTRISREAVHSMVKNSLLRAGLDASKYSAHKLRHTAATLMLQNGVDVRTLQELLGPDEGVNRYGFFQFAFHVYLSARGAGDLLCRPAQVAEPLAFYRQSGVLRLGRAGLYPFNALFHLHQLFRRAAH